MRKKLAAAIALVWVTVLAGLGIATLNAQAATVTVREQQSAASNQAALSFTLSAASQVGDTAILIQTNNWYTAANLQTPAGTAVAAWSLRNTLDLGTNKGHIKIWEGVVTGTGTINVRNSTLDEERYAQLVVVAGAAYDSSAFNSGLSTANHVAPSLVPAGSDELLLTTWEGIGQSYNYTVPAGMTAFTERDITGFITARSASEQLSSSAATGTRTAVASQVSNSFMAASVLLKPTATPPPTTAPATTPPATTAPPTTPPATTPPATTPPPSGFPGPDNTGVPVGTVLTGYTGPCTITVANTVIDAKIVNCNVVIAANNITIKNSRVNGQISQSGNYHFELQDSEVDGTPGAPQQITSVGNRNFLILRSEVTGGNRSVLCERDCTVQDSWLHGQEMPDNVDWHLSAVRLSQYGTLIHNTLSCDKPPNNVDGGCSANQTGYPDFEPTHHWTVRGNLYKGNPGVSYCAYGGNTQGKPYSSDPTNATYIVYQDNVFERGVTNKCGFYGPVTDFAPSRTGNVWTGNVWDSGGAVTP